MSEVITPVSRAEIEEFTQKLHGFVPTYQCKVKLAEALYAHMPDLITIVLAQADLRKADAPKLEGPPPACPDIEHIKAAQVSIWNNWIDGAPKTGNQFGLTLEVWDNSVEDVKLGQETFKTQAALMGGKQLKAHIRKNFRGKPNRPYPTSDNYMATLDTLIKTLEKDTYVALLNTNIRYNEDDYKRGICYHDDQFIIFKGDPLTGKIEKAKLYVNGEKLDINFFTDQPYGKKAFHRKVVLQSRVDLCDFFPQWATNSLDEDAE